MKRPLLKFGMLCWMAGNALLFVTLAISPTGKVATALPLLSRLRELVWQLFYRGTIL